MNMVIGGRMNRLRVALAICKDDPRKEVRRGLFSRKVWAESLVVHACDKEDVGENKMTFIYGNTRCGLKIGGKDEKVRLICPSECVSRLQWHPLGLQLALCSRYGTQSLPPR